MPRSQEFCKLTAMPAFRKAGFVSFGEMAGRLIPAYKDAGLAGFRARNKGPVSATALSMAEVVVEEYGRYIRNHPGKGELGLAFRKHNLVIMCDAGFGEQLEEHPHFESVRRIAAKDSTPPLFDRILGRIGL